MTEPVTRVVDGDTFEADLDRDGHLSFPRERVRLLYVDAPELQESHKGRDLAHGLPARDWLAEALAPPLRLAVPEDRPTGTYGRTLAVVHAGDRNVNVGLIRAGHSPFDTRYSLPPDPAPWEAAEAEAFCAQRGIWAEPASRERYLERLRTEAQRTAKCPANPLFVSGVQAAAAFQPADHVGRYVMVRGTLARTRALSKGVWLLHLSRGADREPLQVVAFPTVAERAGVSALQPGMPLRVEGFIKRYRGRLELALYRLGPTDGS